MKNNYLVKAAVVGTCALAIVACAKFAASAHTKTSPVLQAVAAAPPVATAPAVAAAPAPAAAPQTAVQAAAIAPAAGGKADAPRDFDDWRLLCETPAQGKKQCQIFQRIVSSNANNTRTLALTTVLHPAQLKDKPATGMRLIAPLGIALAPGLALRVDDGKDLKVPYTQCLPGGCLVDMVFDQTLLDKMKAGKSLFVAYRLPNGKDSTLQVSLKGLAPALDAMNQSASKG